MMKEPAERPYGLELYDETVVRRRVFYNAFQKARIDEPSRLLRGLFQDYADAHDAYFDEVWGKTKEGKNS